MIRMHDFASPIFFRPRRALFALTAILGVSLCTARAATVYSIGDPTDEEQALLENLNRARAYPQAEALLLKALTDPDVLEAYSYFGVNLNLMVSQYASIKVAPPLSFNVQLMASARSHSQDMLENAFEEHNGTDGSDPGTRMTKAGYNWWTCGENIFSYGESVMHTHAAFEVDWGTGTGGMQTPAGHRLNDHYSTFREIGISIVDGENQTVGPLVVTQDFAAKQTNAPLLTGVVYYDLNSNGTYDMGEGVGGVPVTIDGANYSAVTTNSGGYSIPLNIVNGNYYAYFAVPGMAVYKKGFTISNLNNTKLDYKLTYTPPAITGTAQPVTGQASTYKISAVPGTTSYEYAASKYSAYSAVEGAENGLTNVIATTTGTYAVIVKDVHASGNESFHLAHATFDPQILMLKAVLRPSSSSMLQFKSRLGWATSTQIAGAQVSSNGVDWKTVWSEAGSNSAGEKSFTPRSVSLSAFAGQELQVRFVYDVSGSAYINTSSGVGLYLDDITMTNAQSSLPFGGRTLGATTSFAFTPDVATTFGLKARSHIGSRILPWGPVLAITAKAATIVK